MSDPAPTETQRRHTHPFLPYRPERIPIEDGIQRGQRLLTHLNARRSVRSFTPDPVPRDAIELAVRIANTAPSGANQQPWTFIATSDPIVKHRIRIAAEEEERAFYHQRALPDWHAALGPLETDEHKPFLDIAPWIVVVFARDRMAALPGAPRPARPRPPPVRRGSEALRRARPSLAPQATTTRRGESSIAVMWLPSRVGPRLPRTMPEPVPRPPAWWNPGRSVDPARV